MFKNNHSLSFSAYNGTICLFLIFAILLYAMPHLYGIELVIPDDTTAITAGQYKNRTDVTSVVIPNSVTSIGYEAFSGCSSLTNVVIPDSVTSIGENAFYGCIALTSLTIPASVKTAYTSCFKGCTGLKTLTINCSGNSFIINANPIPGLDSLTDVIFNNGMPTTPWTFGTSKPVVYGSTKWNGYEFRDIAVGRLESKTLPLPTTSGKIGQVLMVTADGYEWKDVPSGNSTPIADSFHLTAGWNLISLPETELTANCKNELLKAYVFFTYDKHLKIYLRVNELIPRGCYWVFVKDACTIHFTKVE